MNRQDLTNCMNRYASFPKNTRLLFVGASLILLLLLLYPFACYLTTKGMTTIPSFWLSNCLVDHERIQEIHYPAGLFRSIPVVLPAKGCYYSYFKGVSNLTEGELEWSISGSLIKFRIPLAPMEFEICSQCNFYPFCSIVNVFPVKYESPSDPKMISATNQNELTQADVPIALSCNLTKEPLTQERSNEKNEPRQGRNEPIFNYQPSSPRKEIETTTVFAWLIAYFLLFVTFIGIIMSLLICGCICTGCKICCFRWLKWNFNLNM